MMLNKSENTIIGIVPAAGQSRRMGVDKRMMKLGESTLLELSVKSLIDGGCLNVIVVCEVNSSIKRLPYFSNNERVKVCYLMTPSPSMAFTIIQGLRLVPENVYGISVLPADCVLVPPGFINFLNNLFVNQAYQLMVPYYKNQQGHPRYIASSMFSELRGLDMNGKFSNIFKVNPARTVNINTNLESIIKDIDILSDYNELSKRYE